jgi:hypothetical protein
MVRVLVWSHTARMRHTQKTRAHNEGAYPAHLVTYTERIRARTQITCADTQRMRGLHTDLHDEGEKFIFGGILTHGPHDA